MRARAAIADSWAAACAKQCKRRLAPAVFSINSGTATQPHSYHQTQHPIARLKHLCTHKHALQDTNNTPTLTRERPRPTFTRLGLSAAAAFLSPDSTAHRQRHPPSNQERKCSLSRCSFCGMTPITERFNLSPKIPSRSKGKKSLHKKIN